MTGDPYLGIVAAALAGAAANLVFAYLVVGRRANQLAAGLSLMFFGFGLSALIGRPFIGALISGLPQLQLPGLRKRGQWRAALELRHPGLSRGADRGPDLVAAVPHPLGTWCCARSAKARRRPYAAGCSPAACNIRRWRLRDCSAASPARICRSR